MARRRHGSGRRSRRAWQDRGGVLAEVAQASQRPAVAGGWLGDGRPARVDASSADDDLVFAHPHTGLPLPGSPLGERFAAARDAAGVPKITFHGLRHTFGTTLARAGWPVGDIQALMGHADIATTQIYMHYARRHDPGDRIAAAFAGRDRRVAATMHGSLTRGGGAPVY